MNRREVNQRLRKLVRSGWLNIYDGKKLLAGETIYQIVMIRGAESVSGSGVTRKQALEKVMFEAEGRGQ